MSNPQSKASASKRVAWEGNEKLSVQVDGDTWLTPRFILGQLGVFDMDPCPAISNPNWVCPLAIQGDWLATKWHGRVFMNPPFSNTVPWLERHAFHGLGISLVSASVESKIWSRVVWPKAKAILLLYGRTRFCNPDGSTTTGRPLRSVALVAWSEADAEVLRVSTLAGVLLQDWHQR
jgi:hypothetical protein